MNEWDIKLPNQQMFTRITNDIYREKQEERDNLRRIAENTDSIPKIQEQLNSVIASGAAREIYSAEMNETMSLLLNLGTQMFDEATKPLWDKIKDIAEDKGVEYVVVAVMEALASKIIPIK